MSKVDDVEDATRTIEFLVRRLRRELDVIEELETPFLHRTDWVRENNRIPY